MSGVKRQQEDGGGGGCSGGAGGGGGGPPERKKTLFEPCRLGAVSTLEEMDIQVLRFQHQKLKQVNKLVNCFFKCFTLLIILIGVLNAKKSLFLVEIGAPSEIGERPAWAN